MLQKEYRDALVEEALDGVGIIAKLGERKWDLILLDVLMPETNVVEVLSQIRRYDSDVPVLILTAMSETEYAVRTLRAGANGYITKQHASTELIQAVGKVMSGQVYLSGGVAEALAAGMRAASSPAPHDELSKRELEVFCLIARGRSVKEIAFELSLSAKTVGTYITRIRVKTGLVNYVDIARYALQHKLVD